jgi:glycerol-3-phosphate dehydrogenase
MWQRGWRDQVWDQLNRPWDLIVIGGGITGAGILREATRAGLRTLLVEGHDFSSGTSSRSSKMVHGGMRYLKDGQIKLTLESVRERERLLREARGLVSSVGQLMVSFREDDTPLLVFGVGLILYDLLAFRWGHRRYSPAGLKALCPPLTGPGLLGGYRFFDGQADDSRLVLRLIQEAVRDGGIALNYAPVESLLRQGSGLVSGVALRDLAPGSGGRTAEVHAPVVISATGAWADDLRAQVGAPRRLRKLRGSHLIFQASKLPLTRTVFMFHPKDGRPVFAFPWEGVVLAGTTDVDHGQEMQTDLAIQPIEVDYILASLERTFPELNLTTKDVQGTFAGIRSVVNTGKADPSKESREYVLWQEQGLLTIAGGKLTTFRLMAHDALRMVRSRLPGQPVFDPRKRVFDLPPADWELRGDFDPATRLRLAGRYAADAPALTAAAHPGELTPIDGGLSLWAELRWTARVEGVVHLDDLLLRRVRLGLTAPQGGLPLLDRIRAIAQPELGWDDARWQQEAEDYARLWKRCYSPPA